MFDIEKIKESTNLLDLIGSDSVLTGKTELAGPCPKCGGTDRFHVNAGAGWWFCRQCHEQRGDAIEYVMWRDGVTFGEACSVLGGAPTARPSMASRKPASPHVPMSDTPPDMWQTTARVFVDWAQNELMQDTEALDYLVGRGLTVETIIRAKLGYNPRSIKRPGAKWGKQKAVWLPRGWVIPCENDGKLWYVKIRRPAGDLTDPRTPKYHAIAGSTVRGVLYGLDDVGGRWDVIICEGELNALVLRQTLGGVAGVVSNGAAGGVPGRQAIEALVSSGRLWAIQDQDKAGKIGIEQLQKALNVRPLSWPWGDRGAKYDINDAHKDGEDLAQWIIPQIGPADSDKRHNWAAYWAEKLEKAPGFWEQPPTAPTAGVWRAVLGIGGIQ